MAQRQRDIPGYDERYRRLLSAYGALLTERQRSLLEQHVLAKRTFADIAREHGVSRQAVHDAVRRAQRLLETYGACLGRAVTESGSAVPAHLWDAIRARLDDLRKRVAGSGIIYRSDWIVREINAVLEMLPRQPSEGDPG